MSFAAGQSVTVTGLRSKSELNGESGTVQSFDASSGRYTVLVNSKQIKIRPANLLAAGGSGGASGGYYAQAQSTAQRLMQSYGPLLRQIQQHLPGGVSLQTASSVVLLLIFALFYFFGFLRTLVLCAAIGGALVVGFPSFSNTGGGRNGLAAAGAAVGNRISQKVLSVTGRTVSWKVSLAGCAVLLFITFNMLGPSRQVTSRRTSAPANDFDFDFEDDTPTPASYTWDELKVAYDQGFKDSISGLEKGAGLEKLKKAPPRRTTRKRQTERTYSPPHTAPRPARSSSFGISRIMTIGFLGYNVYTLGNTGNGGFDPRLALANASNLPFYRKALLLFLLARALGVSPI